ncbi:MAG: flagellar biosynthesis protein FlhB [Rubellimicrobium sp.]|nr:flagellar biosynthesis protein FlhB [Rubellimicrobium sp.]
MTAQQQPAGDKSFEPTERRLIEARRRGEVPRSADLTTAATYLGLLALGMAMGGTLLVGLGGQLMTLLEHPAQLATLVFAGSGTTMTGGLLLALMGPILPWFVLPAAMAILSEVGQQTIVFATEKLTPKLSRLSPVKAISNKFGITGLFEFAKSLFKLLIYGTVVTAYLLDRSDEILGSASLAPAQASAMLLELLLGMFGIVLVIAVALGLIDLVWQRADFRRNKRMTRKEIMDELKESEGDPALKQQRRQRAVEVAMTQMLADVPKASVVIVNPTHFAVALKWSRMSGGAPVCVAKGVDHAALRIRETALEHGVPIRSDPATARALHAEVDIGEEIRPDHYRAVAAAIRFADHIRHKARTK